MRQDSFCLFMQPFWYQDRVSNRRIKWVLGIYKLSIYKIFNNTLQIISIVGYIDKIRYGKDLADLHVSILSLKYAWIGYFSILNLISVYLQIQLEIFPICLSVVESSIHLTKSPIFSFAIRMYVQVSFTCPIAKRCKYKHKKDPQSILRYW